MVKKRKKMMEEKMPPSHAHMTPEEHERAMAKMGKKKAKRRK